MIRGADRTGQLLQCSSLGGMAPVPRMGLAGRGGEADAKQQGDGHPGADVRYGQRRVLSGQTANCKAPCCRVMVRPAKHFY